MFPILSHSVPLLEICISYGTSLGLLLVLVLTRVVEPSTVFVHVDLHPSEREQNEKCNIWHKRRQGLLPCPNSGVQELK